MYTVESIVLGNGLQSTRHINLREAQKKPCC